MSAIILSITASSCIAALITYVLAYRSGKASGYKRGWADCLRTNGVEL